jgi:C1A family cysteine protease
MKRLHEIAGKPRHLHGWKKGKHDERDQRLQVSWIAGLSLPAKYSLKGQAGLKVEDQGDIGSCTCNSSTTALEFVLLKEKVDVQLSRLYAYARVRELEGTPLSDDSGAEIRDVVKVLAKFGDVLEAHWPYSKNWQTSPPVTLDAEAGKHKAALYLRCGTLRTIKASIARGFPVIGGFQVPANMMSDEAAKTGIVKLVTTEGWEGGHAVLFTGYGFIFGGKSYLQFLNSWSSQWGDGGYGYLDEQFIVKGYADDFWTIRRGTV